MVSGVGKRGEQVVADQREPFFVSDPSADLDFAAVESALQRLNLFGMNDGKVVSPK